MTSLSLSQEALYRESKAFGESPGLLSSSFVTTDSHEWQKKWPSMYDAIQCLVADKRCSVLIVDIDIFANLEDGWPLDRCDSVIVDSSCIDDQRLPALLEKLESVKLLKPRFLTIPDLLKSLDHADQRVADVLGGIVVHEYSSAKGLPASRLVQHLRQLFEDSSFFGSQTLMSSKDSRVGPARPWVGGLDQDGDGDGVADLSSSRLSPWLTRLIGPVDGLNILCTGYDLAETVLHLASRGGRVLAISNSSNMSGCLDLKSQSKNLAIECRKGGHALLRAVQSGGFDMIVSMGIAENPAVASEIMSQYSRILRPGGSLYCLEDRDRFCFAGTGVGHRIGSFLSTIIQGGFRLDEIHEPLVDVSALPSTSAGLLGKSCPALFVRASRA